MDKWIDDDNFFSNHREISSKYTLVSLLDDLPIGFAAWDPRNLPDFAVIGDNCILPEYKGLGYGKAQMQELVRQILPYNPRKIIVSTDESFIPARKMYEAVGFREIGRGVGELDNIIEYEMILEVCQQ